MAKLGTIKTLYQNHRRTTLVLALAAGAVIILAAFSLNGRTQAQYFSAEVEQGDIVQVVNATGTIDAVTTVEVGSQVSGYIAELGADFNSQVRKGDIVARIDSAPVEARVLQADANLASARANLKGLEADMAAANANVNKSRAALREAKFNLERSQELLDQGITSAQQHESVKVQDETAQANLEAAQAQIRQIEARKEQGRAQVRQQQAQLQQARLDLEHTIIRAPIDGTVIARNVDLGQTVAASFSAPTLFTIAQDLTKMLVYAKTDEADVGKIQAGAETTFTVDSFPGLTFRGFVKEVRMNATVVQNVVTYDTIVEFENPDRRLLPGMTAYITIPVAEARGVVKVPNGALRFEPDISDEEKAALCEEYGLSPTCGPKETEEKKAAADGEDSEGTEGERGDGEHGNSGGADRRAERERFQNMSPQERGRMRQQFMARRNQGGGEGGHQRPRARPKATWQVVWKQTPRKTLEPMRIKVGLTDFTFTALLEGELEPGEELIIGQSNGSGSTGRGSSRNLRRGFRRF